MTTSSPAAEPAVGSGLHRVPQADRPADTVPKALAIGTGTDWDWDRYRRSVSDLLAPTRTAGEGLIEAARVAVIPCMLLAALLLLLSLAVPASMTRPVRAVAALVGGAGLIAYVWYVPHSA